jgi:hypothetical protein
VTVVKTLGDVLITATAAPAPPVTFRVGSQEPCTLLTAWVISLERTVSGQLNPYDCNLQSDVGFWDFYFFTIPSQQAVTLRTRAPAFDTRTELFTFDDGKSRAVKIDSIATLNAAVVKAILPPGRYSAGVSSYAVGATGPYELLVSSALPSAASCEEEVWIVRGVTTEQQLASTDCVEEAAPRYQDRFSMFLWEGERLAVAQTSTRFAPHLRLMLRSGQVVAEADGSATGTATIAFTVDVRAAWYIVTASSALAQQSGAYTLTVDAPPAGSQSVSSRSLGRDARRSLVPMPQP